ESNYKHSIFETDRMGFKKVRSSKGTRSADRFDQLWPHSEDFLVRRSRQPFICCSLDEKGRNILAVHNKSFCNFIAFGDFAMNFLCTGTKKIVTGRFHYARYKFFFPSI